MKKLLALSLVAIALTVALALHIHTYTVHRSSETISMPMPSLESYVKDSVKRMLSYNLLIKYIRFKLSNATHLRDLKLSVIELATWFANPQWITIPKSFSFEKIALSCSYTLTSFHSVEKNGSITIEMSGRTPISVNATAHVEGNALVYRSISKLPSSRVGLKIETVDRVYLEKGDVKRIELREYLYTSPSSKRELLAISMDIAPIDIVKRIELGADGKRLAIDLDLDRDTIAVNRSGRIDMLSDDDTKRFVELLKNLDKYIDVELLNSSTITINQTVFHVYTFRIRIDVSYRSNNISIEIHKDSTIKFIAIAKSLLFTYSEHIKSLSIDIEVDSYSAILKARDYGYSVEYQYISIFAKSRM